ncbi:hybrid sensor histidine kinase/response regulator [Phenylobacterium sp.]|uniref:ATP-binding response regulator n=1 Tax=Phenylobacterium sp. TaxID=1871053 RepID=UPI00120BA26E|nr:hybrid sensor histidine kinase/response regulator [Phenylobacterium sp.]THD51551.1 MAG: hybrid sensor histidine kinase/response regulator [Phenylobacterium sp.]
MSEASAKTPLRDTVPLSDLVRAEQVRLLYSDGGIALWTTAGVAAALVVILIQQKTLGTLPAAAFLSAMVLQTAARIALRSAYWRVRPGVADWRRWGDRFVGGTVAGGFIWGLALPWLLPPGRMDLQALVMSIMIAGTYNIIGSAGAYLPAFYAFVLPFIGVVGWFVSQDDMLHFICTAMLLLWLPTVAVLGRRYNARLLEALELRFEKAALADDLHAQKHAAEQANLAKSRFLASASHDLRQPVHALAMFVGALRSHDLPTRSAELVEHMDASISGLDGLFASLLDVSRLDAGVIESRPAVLELQPLLARICRDLQAEALAKDIELRVAPTTASVRSDPVLLERILRNLIGNAVRYTDRGGVLVGARRRGSEVSVEVWDTGCGIAEEQQQVIFEDFYQVADPERTGGAGLGLGLAIVRRLTGILGHSLTLRSVLGRGSVFRLKAPRVATAVQTAASLPAARPPADPERAFILAIDDEAPIRIAMSELLSSWGYRVGVARGASEALSKLDGWPTPDLIVCDYRLARGESGLDAIARLQAAVGVLVPAIVVTGETAPDQLRAVIGGYPVLHKPLAPPKLRAAVTGLLRRAAPGAGVAAE